MKKQFPKTIALIGLLFLCNTTFTQSTICYPLTSNFEAKESNQPPIETLSNASGQVGDFVSQPANNNLCTSGENIPIFNFADNAGLRFDNSESFIGCEYTVEYVYKQETFPSFPGILYTRIFGFSNDDTGIFFYDVPFSDWIVLEFWQNNTQLFQCPINFFNEQDWYKLTFVRSCSGLVEVFVNCEFMCSYDDSTTQLFLPKPATGNQIIFFQDDNTTLVGESASGFVKNLKISNFAKTATDVVASCDCLCEEMVGCEITINALSSTCNPDEVISSADTLLQECSCTCDTILMTEVILLSSDSTFLEMTTCDGDSAGIFYENLQNSSGCDSIVVFNINLAESPSLQDTVVIADTGNSSGSIALNIVGGAPPYAYFWSTGSNDSTITNLPFGNYSVTVSDQNNCELVFFFEVDMLNALSELPASSFQIFPNPIISRGLVYVQTNNSQKQIYQLNIFDTSGQLVYQKYHQVLSGTNYFSWTATLESGIYFLRIKDEEGRSEVRKVVVLD